ncbi:hypothetical protein NM688_g1065 [Phlebia brevispora]|uniref:Uncharacterized protein n=1 Tax=Phlebia brevispora TaxID=194682 RepID=A0ACC1TCC6_9APHY|nr:hypothetical protein NM688_g1065 [Phlebia brevispora]
MLYQPLIVALSWLSTALAAATFYHRTDSEIDVSGPFVTGINCPTYFNWTGGEPPYTLTFSNIDTPGRTVPVESYTDIASTDFTWIPHNNDTGQELLVTVSDDQGDEGSFGWIVVSTQETC